MKLGVEFKINVNDIDKSKLYKGQKGTYLTLTSFVEVDKPDKYDNNGFITQKGDKGVKMPILGNAKVFWKEGGSQVSQAAQSDAPSLDPFDDEMPF